MLESLLKELKSTERRLNQIDDAIECLAKEKEIIDGKWFQILEKIKILTNKKCDCWVLGIECVHKEKKNVS